MIWLSRRPIQLVRLAWLLMLVTCLASIGIPASAFLCDPYSEEEYILSPGLPVCPGTTIYVTHIVRYYKVVGYNPCTYELDYEVVTHYTRLPDPNNEIKDCTPPPGGGGGGGGGGEGPPPPPCTDPTTCCDGLDGPTG